MLRFLQASGTVIEVKESFAQDIEDVAKRRAFEML